MSDFWEGAEIISMYTRQQAIEDGVLKDVTPIAKRYGILFPVAIASEAWSTCVAWSEGEKQAVLQEERLIALLNRLYIVIKTCPDRETDRITFQHTYIDRESGKQEIAELVSVVGPGDNAEPVITVMFPWED